MNIKFLTGKHIFSISFFLIVAAILPSCKNSSEHTVTRLDDDTLKALENAEGLYKEYCSGCHGNEIQIFVNRSWRYGTDETELYNTISRGVEDDGMPAFEESFTEQQINDLVTYIQYHIVNLNRYEFDDDFSVSDTFAAAQFNYYLEEVAIGFNIPWGMAFFPDGGFLVTDKSGTLWKVANSGEKIEISGVPAVVDYSQGGMLDVEVHPDFTSNNYIYLSYSKLSSQNRSLATTAVSRFVLKDGVLTDSQLIFEALPYATTRHHYGSRLEFDDNGYLYITVGDRGARDVNPQDLSKLPGKVHRVNDDGSIPPDNPFIDKEGAVRSIFSYGHRNQQGMVKNPFTGEMWTHEHGPKGGDEINIVRSGLNYGWPIISYGINYDGSIFTEYTEMEGMEEPLHYWVPSIAPSGMDFVSSDKYPGWEGALLVGSLKYKYLNLCYISGESVTAEELLLKGIGRLRNVKQGSDGFIYLAKESPGVIYRIIPLSK